MPGEQRLGTAIAIELQQPFAMSATNPAWMAGLPLMDRHHQIVVVDRRDDGPQGRWLHIGMSPSATSQPRAAGAWATACARL